MNRAGSTDDGQSADSPAVSELTQSTSHHQHNPTSATVQAEISRAARETLSRYPIGTTLLRPDLASLVSNLSIADPEPMSEFTNALLEPFHHSLALIDRALLQSGPESSALPERLSPDQLGWARQQLQTANRLMEQHFSQSCSFKDLPYSPVTSFAPAPALSPLNPSHPATIHANLVNIPLPPSSLAQPTPSHGPPPDADTVKSSYHQFITHTLEQQLHLNQSHQSNNHSVDSTPIQPTPLQTPSQFSSQLPTPSRHDTESPDPLDMTIPTRSQSAHLNRRRSVPDEGFPTPTPLSKKRRQNPLITSLTPKPASSKRITPISIKLPASLPPAIEKLSRQPQVQSPASSPCKPIIPPTPAAHQNRDKKPGSQLKIVNPPTSCQDPVSQLLSLIEDILEADDMASESPEIFCRLQSELILSPPLLSILKSFIDQSNGEGIAKVPVGELARLMKILDRGVKCAESLNVVPPELKQKQQNQRSSLLDASDDRPPSSKKSGPKKSRLSGGRASKPSSKKKSARAPCAADEELLEDDVIDESPKSRRGPASKPRSTLRISSELDGGDGEESGDEQLHAPAIEERLRDLLIALHSVDVTLAILAYDKYLPKQFYSEELIRSIMTSTKNQMTSVIYPFVEAGEKGTLDGYLQRLRKLSSASSIISERLALCFSFFSTSILPKIDTLLRRIELSESILIHVAYIAIGPFFLDCGPLSALPGSTKTRKSMQANGSMKTMRLECLKLLRNISSKYPDQRGWIVDEILSSVVNLPDQSARNGKGVYHLANGKCIQTLSALLLHIVQCCFSGVRTRISAILSSADPIAADTIALVKEGTPPLLASSKKLDDPASLESIKECIEPGLSSATQLSKKIIMFLLQKSGKSSKLSHETHYRAVFDRLLEDLTNLLFLPDWPVAEFMLGLCCKTMMTLLESTKVSADTNAAKSMCLDHLGPITARLMERTEDLDTPSTPMASSSFKAMVKGFDRASLLRLFQSQKNVLLYLDALSNSDDPSNTAAEFLHARWTLELINAAKGLQVQIDLKRMDIDEDHEKQADDKGSLNQKAVLDDLHARIEELGTMRPMGSVPMASRQSSDGLTAALKDGVVNEMISKVQGLKGMADLFLDRILAASASSSVTFRSKAIKALGLVVAKDEMVFFKESVRKAVENRMLDSSPAVRDATIELVGKYVVNRPDLAVTFLPQISSRVADKGISVRRRVVKLLKAIYVILDDEECIDLKADISHRLISRIHDEESSIRELAMNAIDELWFRTTSKVFDVGLASTILMRVTATYKELPSPVEAVMKCIMKQHAKKSPESCKQFTQCCQDVVEHLIDQLMDVAVTARDSAFTEVECIKTICILTFSCPKLLAPNKALMLLPYLKGATTLSEQVMMHYLLKIFRVCVTETPKLSGEFGERLQSTLLLLVNKPNLNGGGAILQELVACFCAVVIHQTRDYNKLLSVFKACEQRLKNEVGRLDDASSGPNLKSLPLLMYLVSTLVAYGELDRLSSGQENIRDAFRVISQDPIHMHVYNLLMHVYGAERATKIRSMTLTCLGFLYKSYPMLMTRRESLELMDGVLSNPSGTELQHRLLKLVADFIASQNERSGDDNDEDGSNGVDINQLIGHTEGFADSGVASAIVQRYLGQITTLAQSTQPQLQRTAVDIIAFTIKQGLAHPLECVPVLVALESSADQILAKRVFGLHMLLHVQRANLVHSRFLETMDKVHDYHEKAAGENSVAMGYLVNPTRSVMASWYQLLNEKRAWRLEFLKALTKSFLIDPQSSAVDQSRVRFHRYLAEGILTLELKTEEEALVVIESLNRNIGQSAYQTLHLLGGDQLTVLLGGGEDSNVCAEAGSRSKSSSFHSSIVLGIGFVLRDLLKQLYGISEQKLSKFMEGLDKKKPSGSRSSKDIPASRKINVNDIAVQLSETLRNKVPGLEEKQEEEVRFQRQLEAFGEMVRDDGEAVVEDEDQVMGTVREEEEEADQDAEADEDGDELLLS